jgi:hypothetical protein
VVKLIEVEFKEHVQACVQCRAEVDALSVPSQFRFRERPRFCETGARMWVLVIEKMMIEDALRENKADNKLRKPLDPEEASLDQLYRLAMSRDYIQENSCMGLGSASIEPGSVVTLECVLTKPVWPKRVVLDGSIPPEDAAVQLALALGADEAQVERARAAVRQGVPKPVLDMAQHTAGRDTLVEEVRLGSVLMDIGTNGVPMSFFAANSTRFGIHLPGDQVAAPGQALQVRLRNIGEHKVIVSGAVLGNELSEQARAVVREFLADPDVRETLRRIFRAVPLDAPAVPV